MPAIPSVNDNELLLTDWGNAVVAELNGNVVKRDGSASVTGTLVLHPATNIPPLRIRRPGDAPQVFFETVGGVVLGHVQGHAGGLILNANDAGDAVSLRVAGTEYLRVFAGNIYAPDSQFTGRSAVLARADNANQLVLVDESGGGVGGHAYVGLYPSGTASATGARGGYVGFAGEGLQVQADIGGLTLQAANGDVDIVTDAGVFKFSPSGQLLLGTAKMTGGPNPAVVGLELWGEQGYLVGTVNTAIPNINLNRISAAAVAGGEFLRFNTVGTERGSITWETSDSKVHYNQTSDRRLKVIVGPVADPAARVKALRPRRLAWIESGAEFDGFIADEVAEVVPEAVSGEPDAVNDDGTVKPQQLAAMELIPVLTAALAQALDRIDVLEQQVALLGGAG